MRAEGTRAQRYSSLAKRAYSSISPVSLHKPNQRAPVQTRTSKYPYLSFQSNQSQQILKELISAEKKHMKSWKTPGYGVSEPFTTTSGTVYGVFRQGHSTNCTPAIANSYSSNQLGNFGRVANKPTTQTDLMSASQAYFSKGHVRTRSFDPILGTDKEFKTPSSVFKALGSNHADLYKLSGIHRTPSLSQFQTILRK